VADSQPPATTVLVVEDNTITRGGLVVVLRRHGYDAIAATDGGAALALLAGGMKPDVILLDMLMPVVDGWRFLDRIRASLHGSIPIVITTGTNLTREWAESHGCAGFLHKPYDESDLLAELARALNST
jgi:CheY-like chemotaxis protein